MDAEQTPAPQDVPLEPEIQHVLLPPAYMVARSAQGIDNVNTIDIVGERPFSV
jgi:hypothetical protein